jgi:hypothetical protein
VRVKIPFIPEYLELSSKMLSFSPPPDLLFKGIPGIMGLPPEAIKSFPYLILSPVSVVTRDLSGSTDTALVPESY